MAETAAATDPGQYDRLTRGIHTMRYSWTDVVYHACQTAAEIAWALQRRGWTGQLIPCPSCPALLAA